MNINLWTVPHMRQRYATVGDWLVDPNGDLRILVSEMANKDHEFLVMLHELIEAYLCQKAGVTQDMVDKFDLKFEKERTDGIHGTDEEPGADPNAPYRVQHTFAETIERAVADQLGVKWDEYSKAVSAL